MQSGENLHSLFSAPTSTFAFRAFARLKPMPFSTLSLVAALTPLLLAQTALAEPRRKAATNPFAAPVATKKTLKQKPPLAKQSKGKKQKTSEDSSSFDFASQSSSSSVRDSSSRSLPIDRIENRVNGSVIHFKKENGKQRSPLDTDLFDIEYLGELLPSSSPSKETLSDEPSVAVPVQSVHLMIARPCSLCSDEKQIYAVRNDGRRSTHFVKPGRIIDPKTGAVVFESQAFYGRCLKNQGTDVQEGDDVYVVFQQERLDRKHSLQPSVFLAKPSQELIEEKLLETRKLPSLRYTLGQVKRGECFRIDTSNRLMREKAISLRPKRPGDPLAEAAAAAGTDEDGTDEDGTDEDGEDKNRPDALEIELSP